MQNKLQELTDRLYQEGLSKGKEEGDKYLAEAQERSAQIIAQAEEKATAIIAQAQAQAQDLSHKAASDVKMASQQALQATKKDIEDLLLHQIVGQALDSTLGKTDLMKEVILAVAKNFSAQESCELKLVLSEKLQKDLEGWIKTELSKKLDAEVKAEFSKKIQGGFSIGPKDGSYFISLSDQTFNELICEYLRPVTKKLLFGE